MSTGSNTNKNYKNNKNNEDKVKITTELTNDFEVSFALHKDQCYLSEEIALKELIESSVADNEQDTQRIQLKQDSIVYLYGRAPQPIEEEFRI